MYIFGFDVIKCKQNKFRLQFRIYFKENFLGANEANLVTKKIRNFIMTRARMRNEYSKEETGFAR